MNKGTIYGKWMPAMGVFAAMALFFVIAMLLTPIGHDDMRFLNDYLAVNGGSHRLSAGAVWRFWRQLTAVDCARLSNPAIVAGVLSPTGYVLVKCILGISVGVVGMLAAMLISNSQSKQRGSVVPPTLLISALVWAAMMVFLPWRHYMLIMSFSSNYVLSSLMLLGFVWLVFVRGCGSAWTTLWAIVLALLVATWHEGFAMPMVCAMVFVGLLPCFKARPWWWMCVGAMLVIVALMFSLTFISERWAVESAVPAWRDNTLNYLLCNCLALALAAVALCSMCTRRSRRWAQDLLSRPVFAFMAALSVTSAVIAAFTEYTSRTGFLAQLAGMVCWGIILLPMLQRISRRWDNVLGACLTALLIAQGAWASVWCLKFYRQHCELMAMMRQGESTTVFRDLIMPCDVPIAVRTIPMRSLWLEPYHYATLHDYVGSRELTVAVVPTALNRSDLASLPTLDGGDISVVDGVAFKRRFVESTKPFGNDMRCCVLDADYVLEGSDKILSGRCMEMEFSAPDGNKYYYLAPLRNPALRIKWIKVYGKDTD